MTRFNFLLSIVLSGLVSSLVCVNVQAQDQDQGQQTTTTTTTTQTPTGDVTKVVETRHDVTTAVPAPKEIIATPTGYVSCFTVEAGWNDDLWVPAHKVCQYNNSVEGVAWIEGYWRCNKATTDGVCTNWEWKAGHWQKTLTSVY